MKFYRIDFENYYAKMLKFNKMEVKYKNIIFLSQNTNLNCSIHYKNKMFQF
jgi:hypothetical protein